MTIPFSDFRINYDLKHWLGEEISLIAAVNNLFNARYSSNGWTYAFRSRVTTRARTTRIRARKVKICTIRRVIFHKRAATGWRPCSCGFNSISQLSGFISLLPNNRTKSARCHRYYLQDHSVLYRYGLGLYWFPPLNNLRCFCLFFGLPDRY